MLLNLKPKSECTYDALALGEVMLRLDPGNERICTARNFRVWEGGGEYNVSRALCRSFGMKTAIITAFAQNEIGRLLEDLILQGGVSTEFIKWFSTDGASRACRNGLNFTERGFGIRGALGCSDRANTAISKAKFSDFDFENIFGKLGVRWFHTGGVYAALSEHSKETALFAIKTAKKYGTIVSYDLNYRPSLWSAHNEKNAAQKTNTEIAKNVDVLVGNEEDFFACLGFEIKKNANDFSFLHIKGYEKMLKKVCKIFPNLKVVAVTLRKTKTATINDWCAMCFSQGKIYKSKNYENLEIFDRVGAGDAFCAGLIYGLVEKKSAVIGTEYGAACAALAMTTPGDNSMANLQEIEEVANSKIPRIKR